MYGLCTKVVCLFKLGFLFMLVKVTDNRKDTNLLRNMHIFINNESIMFYIIDPG